MQKVGRPYPHCGYGGRFWDWMYSSNPKPYKSFGNGAEATVVAGFMARTGSFMDETREVIDREYYPMDFTLDGIRDTYQFNETCQNTVPQALMAFFESTSFEEAIRNATSIGGDSDTLAAIAGGVAEVYYGVPAKLREKAVKYLDGKLFDILILYDNR